MSALYAARGLSWPKTRRHPKGIPPQSEADFMASVVTYAGLMGWRVFHPYDSRRSTSGWPDLACTRARNGFGRLVLAELKSASGVVSGAQQEWLDALGKCPGTEVYLWRPEHWQEIQKVLR